MNDPRAEERLRVQLAELRSRFYERTRGDAALFEDALARLLRGEAADLAQLQNVAHKIYGGGATLQLPHLSDCGGEIERVIIELGSTAAGPAREPLLARLTEALARLRHTLEAIASGARN